MVQKSDVQDNCEFESLIKQSYRSTYVSIVRVV
jgi:hypothetical protein